MSEYTSKDVVDSFKKTFESYWNDEECRTFKPTDEDNRKELKESLKSKVKDDNSYLEIYLIELYNSKKMIKKQDKAQLRQNIVLIELL